MGVVDQPVARVLDEAVPPRPGPDGWTEIIGAAELPERAGRGWLVRAIPVTVFVSGAIVVALAWPFGGGPRGTVLERAAAAVGDGPVLHVVVRSGSGGTLIDLKTGARREIHGEQEIWYDPARGIHQVSRFAGVLQGDAIYPPDRRSYLDKTLGGLASGYRAALRDGSARMLGPDLVEGKPVYWIRVHTEMLPDVADDRLHAWAHDVAVSQDTLKPVATREARDGKPGPDGNSIILEVETLPADQGDFTRVTHDADGAATKVGRTGSLTPIEASEVLGRPALWAGRSIANIDLARTWKDARGEGYDRQTGAWKTTTYTGVTFFYGTIDEKGDPANLQDPGSERANAPWVQISESRTLDLGFQRGVLNYSPPEGSILVFGGRTAVMKQDGLYFTLGSSTEDLLLRAARALERVPAG
jgi:hypothetical protein